MSPITEPQQTTPGIVAPKVEAAQPSATQPVDLIPDNYFVELAKLNIQPHVEKKGSFNYLSWAHAVDFLFRKHPNAQIIVKKFPDVTQGGALVPFYRALGGYFVEVEVIVNGISRCEPFAVTNNKNFPIKEPTVADINNSLQRAKVKMIAMHGLGLHIYAGEDFPKAFDGTESTVQQQQNFTQQPEYQQQQQYEQNYNYDQQQAYQNQQQAPPAPPVMTDMQKNTLRELAQHISVLQNPHGAPPQQINDTVREVYNYHQLTATLTPQQADDKITELHQALKNLQDNRMVSQEQQPVQSSGMFNEPA